MESWPSVVLVDLDNTLHDYRTAAAGVRTALALLLERKHGIPRDLVRTRYEHLVAAETGATFATGYDLRVARLRSLLDTWPQTRGAEHAPFVAVLETALLDGVRPFPGAIEAYRLVESKGRAMVLTEGYADIQSAIAARLGLPVNADAFFASRTHSVRKADGTAFRRACELLRAEAREIVMVGDNWDWDVIGAAKAGMWQVWIGSGDRDRTSAPNGYLGKVAAFRDLPALLSSVWRTRYQPPDR